MPSRNTLSLLAAALLALTGCAANNPGTGTKTLFVDATAQSDGSSGGTWIAVTIRQGASNGNFVQDAQVVAISDRGTQQTLTWGGIFGIGGYSVSGFPWEAGWHLKITRGADQLEGYVAGPGLTTITNPAGGAAFSRSSAQPLAVKWRDESGRAAQTVEVTLDHANYDQLRSGDSGEFDIPAGTWTQSTNDERLTVTRTSTVSLAGGVDGSTFKARTIGQVRFPVQ